MALSNRINMRGGGENSVINWDGKTVLWKNDSTGTDVSLSNAIAVASGVQLLLSKNVGKTLPANSVLSIDLYTYLSSQQYTSGFYVDVRIAGTSTWVTVAQQQKSTTGALTLVTDVSLDAYAGNDIDVRLRCSNGTAGNINFTVNQVKISNQ